MDKTRVEDPRPEQHKQSGTDGYAFRSLFQHHQEMVPAMAAADKSAILWRMLKLILCFSFYKVITRPNSLLGKHS